MFVQLDFHVYKNFEEPSSQAVNSFSAALLAVKVSESAFAGKSIREDART
jgi:hypothetical protein